MLNALKFVSAAVIGFIKLNAFHSFYKYFRDKKKGKRVMQCFLLLNN